MYPASPFAARTAVVMPPILYPYVWLENQLGIKKTRWIICIDSIEIFAHKKAQQAAFPFPIAEVIPKPIIKILD
jgi:hypothetical protein